VELPALLGQRVLGGVQTNIDQMLLFTHSNGGASVWSLVTLAGPKSEGHVVVVISTRLRSD